MRTRIKTHQFPGDIGKATKIRMLESREPFSVWTWQQVSPKAIRSFRRVIQMRERAVLERETRKLIDEQIEEGT
jgi:hypothetical protein